MACQENHKIVAVITDSFFFKRNFTFATHQGFYVLNESVFINTSSMLLALPWWYYCFPFIKDNLREHKNYSESLHRNILNLKHFVTPEKTIKKTEKKESSFTVAFSVYWLQVWGIIASMHPQVNRTYVFGSFESQTNIPHISKFLLLARLTQDTFLILKNWCLLLIGPLSL